jgi:iron complex outermembrane receptor protein
MITVQQTANPVHPFRSGIPCFLGCFFLASSALAQISPAPGTIKKSEDTNTVQLSEFVVNSTSDTGYDVTNSVSGVRFRTELLTLPKTINIATAEFIQDIGATDLAQIIAAMTGGTIETPSGNGATDLGVRLRGVAGTFVYRDGMRGFAPVDPVSIDRVEIIKGPSSFFGGQVQPGGFINYVTKQPNGKKFTALRQSFGSYDTYRTEVENSGAIEAGQNKKITYRLTAAYQSNGSFREFEHQKKWSPYIALSYPLFRDTTISANFQYLKREMDYASTNLLFLTLGPGVGNYTPYRPRKDFNGYGDKAFINIGTALTGVSVDHRFARWLSLRASLFQSETHHTRFNPNLGQTIATNATTGARTITRSNLTFLNQANQDRTARTDLLGNWEFELVKLKAYAGWERVYGKFMVVNLTSPANSLTPLNIDRPDYTISAPGAATVGTPNPFYGIYDALSGGIQAQVFEKLFFYTGTRHDDGYSNKPAGKDILPTSKFKVNTPHIGASYKITPNVAVFVGKAQSFVPNAGLRFDSTLLDPLTGKGTDVGVKFSEFLGGKLSGTITAFDQEISNTVIADPDHPGFNTTSGASNKIKGAEFDLSYRPLPNWRMVVGYSNLESKIVFSPTPAAIGLRTPNTPTHGVNFLSNYSFTTGALKGLGIIVTGNYVSSRRQGSGVTPDTSYNRYPGYKKADVVFNYGAKISNHDVRFSLGLRNVTNAEYIAGGWGVPRNFDGSVSTRF